VSKNEKNRKPAKKLRVFVFPLALFRSIGFASAVWFLKLAVKTKTLPKSLSKREGLLEVQK